jgi:hypothetical protein
MCGLSIAYWSVSASMEDLGGIGIGAETVVAGSWYLGSRVPAQIPSEQWRSHRSEFWF